MKKVVLCADDYGQNTDVSKGILKLIRRQRLTATSCMVTGRNWLEQAEWLKPFAGKVDIGLHFNLTHGWALGDMPGLVKERRLPEINTLLLRAYQRKFTVKTIAEELVRQLQTFIEGVGQLPDFIDGHQHVHHLPGVRQAVQWVWQDQLQQHRCYFRSVRHIKGVPFSLKSWVIKNTGSRAFERWLNKNGILHNTNFSGIYDLINNATSFPKHCQRFFQAIQNQGLIMCHPGLESADTTDPIRASRPQELAFLLSEDFDALLAASEVKLVRGLDW